MIPPRPAALGKNELERLPVDCCGEVNFENEAYFLKREDGYKLVWTDALIYPGLASTDKVRVSTTQAKRGEILDRNGSVLAGPGVASSVGIVPGRCHVDGEDREDTVETADTVETTDTIKTSDTIAQIAELLDLSREP